MTAYFYDGNTFDLDVPHADVFGTHWTWTGEYNTAGEPLMQSVARERSAATRFELRERGAYDQAPIPLPDVYHDHGPLIPMHPVRITDAAWTGEVAA